MCVRITHLSCAGLLGNCLANMWTNYLPTSMVPASREATPPSVGNMESKLLCAARRSNNCGQHNPQHDHHASDTTKVTTNLVVFSLSSIAVRVIGAGLHYDCEAAPAAAFPSFASAATVLTLIMSAAVDMVRRCCYWCCGRGGCIRCHRRCSCVDSADARPVAARFFGGATCASNERLGHTGAWPCNNTQGCGL